MQNKIPEVRIADQYSYSRAGPCDARRICGIVRLCYADPWPLKTFEDELADNELARYFIAEPKPRAGYGDDGAAGVIYGFCGYWAILDQAHIMNVAVHPAFRGRGVGAGLMDAMLRDARGLGLVEATLEARRGNDAAINLYLRFGFERAGVRKGYYDRGATDALIMWKRFA